MTVPSPGVIGSDYDNPGPRGRVRAGRVGGAAKPRALHPEAIVWLRMRYGLTSVASSD